MFLDSQVILNLLKYIIAYLCTICKPFYAMLKKHKLFSMSIKMIIFSILVLVVIVLFAYNQATDITFTNGRAHISSVYCKLSGVPKSTKPVILLPGTKGSALKDAQGKTRWLSLWEILPSGLTGVKPLDYTENDGVVPDGILFKVSIVPKLIEYRPYFKITAELACSPNSYVYGYDWRKNPADNVAGLSELVDRVTKETGQKPSIIGHSMGGLITHYYMKTNSAKVDRVVYVGTPFGSGMSFFEDLDSGAGAGLNHSLLSREALFSHPGSFALLPHPGVKLYKDQDLMDVKTWRDNLLSAYKDGFAQDGKLEQVLQKAKDFFAVIDAPQKMDNQFMFVIGNCQDTLYSIDADGHRNMKPGDSRVLEEAALPVEKDQINKTIYNSCAAHGDQLNDGKVVQAVLDFLK